MWGTPAGTNGPVNVVWETPRPPATSNYTTLKIKKTYMYYVPHMEVHTNHPSKPPAKAQTKM